ncbi:MAG: hypothetical protein R3E42_00025 [Burkholderiaceae bacterium]
MNEAAFADLFRQSDLQSSIANALDQIENQLTISLGQMLNVVTAFYAGLGQCRRLLQLDQLLHGQL